MEGPSGVKVRFVEVPQLCSTSPQCASSSSLPAKIRPVHLLPATHFVLVPLHLPAPQKFAQSIFYPLLKVCFNQIRYQWGALPHGAAPSAAHAMQAGPGGGFHSGADGERGASSSSSSASASSSAASPPWLGPQRPVVRMAEAEALLGALRSAGNAGASTSGRASGGGGGSGGMRGGGGGSSVAGAGGGGSTLLSQPPESVNWQQHAVMAYRDMVTTGHKPSVDVIDMLLGCLRLKHVAQEEEGGGGSGGSDALSSHTQAPSQPGFSAPSSQHLGGGAGMGMGMGMGRAAGSPLGMPGLSSLGGHVGRQPWEAPVLAAAASPSPQQAAAAAALAAEAPPTARSGQRYESGFDKR